VCDWFNNLAVKKVRPKAKIYRIEKDVKLKMGGPSGNKILIITI